MIYFWIFLGGGLGSIARFAGSGIVARLWGETFPWGTVMVNLSGSLLIGFIDTLSGTEGRWLASPNARAFLMIGICGGYTTFSSFSLQTLALARDGEMLKAGANVVLSCVLCLLAVWLGHLIAASINTSRSL